MRSSRLPALTVLVFVILSAGLYFLDSSEKGRSSSGGATKQGEAPENPALAALPGDDPESALEGIFAEIEANRLNAALQRVEDLIGRYPTFRLAHLIKGDLLLARARPLSGFGAMENAPAEKVADLRAEAVARLKGYRFRPSAENVPRYLLRMRDDQRYAIVIDTTKSRLYLYRNENGRPRFEMDFYMTQGRLGAGKFAEGDKRTPIGTYHVTSFLPPEKLPDLYGHGAFPINYPNEWDKRRGRGGSGIWLHGTSSDTFSRPPKASDGCVVLANPDFDRLGTLVQVGLTPVIISSEVEWLSPNAWQQERQELDTSIEAWRADWESLDTERYLDHYSPDFKSGGQDFAAFARQKRAVNRGKAWIKVKLDRLAVFRNPGPEDLAVVTFDQVYESSNLSNTMKKRQYWQKENGRWKIIYEGAA
jgi:murein L,D-transpeptidase YafK